MPQGRRPLKAVQSSYPEFPSTSVSSWGMDPELFWRDKWVDHLPLKEALSRIFALSVNKEGYVKDLHLCPIIKGISTSEDILEVRNG